MKLDLIDTIDKDWSLFLDRDGVINELLEGQYVNSLAKWRYTENALEALEQLSNYFKHTFVVTNQQGIGKGIMTEEELAIIHQQLYKDVEEAGGKIDKIYHAPQLASQYHSFRKPRTGMAKQAQKDFPGVNFRKSVMIGDFITDMQFAKKLDMIKVFINKERKSPKEIKVDYCFESLFAFCGYLFQK